MKKSLWTSTSADWTELPVGATLVANVKNPNDKRAVAFAAKPSPEIMHKSVG